MLAWPSFVHRLITISSTSRNFRYFCQGNIGWSHEFKQQAEEGVDDISLTERGRVRFRNVRGVEEDDRPRKLLEESP